MNLFRQLMVVGVASLVLGTPPATADRPSPSATVADLLSLDVRPVAIGHRGFGENLGDDRSRPIENTIKAVRRGFRAGLSVVEVDVQLTRDGQVAVMHDDFLLDGRCVNGVTLSELQDRLSHVPTLKAILKTARKANDDDGSLRGLVIVELKPAAPACDPDDSQERTIVSTVAAVVRRAGMTEQVMFTSFSPALLSLAAHEAPAIARILAVNGVQLLDFETVTQLFYPLPVVLIDKELDLGLEWVEIGPLYRLPGYRSLAALLATAAVVRAAVVEADIELLEAIGASLVPVLHASGFKVFGYTANDADDWELLEALGVDAIYTNDVPLGVASQPPIP
jgi:glycerophosphoryl diester phosphodiesterase